MDCENTKSNSLTKLLDKPNWHSDVYRTLEPSADVTKLEKYLDFIDINEDGNVLLGSSDLTGRNWKGSVWYCKDTESITKLDNCLAKMPTMSGVTDAKFVRGTKALIVEDFGLLSLVALTDNTELQSQELTTLMYSEEHESGITEVSLAIGDQHFVTGSMDGCIKYWDLEHTPESKDCLVALHTYQKAHRHIVSSVCASTADKEVFASCSLDGEALLWDTRMEKPARGIYENEFCGLTRLAWHPVRSELIVIGSEKGDIYLIDIREPNQFVTKAQLFNRGIYRLRFNDASMLGVCADDSIVKIIDCGSEGLNTVYVDENHTDMVRGLAWKNPSHMLSCGWDKNIFHHYI